MSRMTIGGLCLVTAILAAPAAFGEWQGVREMYGVRWHPTLQSAITAATPTQGAAKPIAWFRVLGDLDGLT